MAMQENREQMSSAVHITCTVVHRIRLICTGKINNPRRGVSIAKAQHNVLYGCSRIVNGSSGGLGAEAAGAAAEGGGGAVGSGAAAASPLGLDGHWRRMHGGAMRWRKKAATRKGRGGASGKGSDSGCGGGRGGTARELVGRPAAKAAGWGGSRELQEGGGARNRRGRPRRCTIERGGGETEQKGKRRRTIERGDVGQ
ncbi:hypothetical protein [Oryza sativa Japonica Group]|uniref:Uncharacterized protein n=1 Tax=Oryza sativa subsp. japonica TaxID=39947 RepID=Q5SN28_ORYSJ|nr:hypothetical protein [Oryza sativa Japonica Group]